jgi:hypothetical protein
MKKVFMGIGLILLVTLLSVGTASASLLGSLTHDYGSGEGKTDPGGTDPLSSDYVLVRDYTDSGNNSDRFTDTFDYHSLAYDSIEEFVLTLEFSNTDRSAFFVPVEDWRVRPGGTEVASEYFDINRVGDNKATQSFTIDSGFSVFDTLADGSFEYWFAEESLFENQFKLYNATLEVYGTPSAVPLPAAVWLLGCGLVGLAGFRCRMTR